MMRKVVQYSREVIPAPAQGFELGEVGLPQFMDSLGGMLKFARCAVTIKAGLLMRSKRLRMRILSRNPFNPKLRRESGV
jgi:hypothetical protein